MTDYSNDVALMFPATVMWDGETNVDTHVTCVYLGDVADITFTKDELLKALRPYIPLDVGQVFPRSLELFGENKDYLVTTLEDFQLDIINSLVLNIVKGIGGSDASSFKDYKPHVTLQDEFTGSVDNFELPSKIVLQPLQLWWGNEKIDLDKD